MDFGRGFSIREEKESQIQGPWIPVTPAKPIPTRPQPISGTRQGNQLSRAHWFDSVGFPAGFHQETPTTSNGVTACLNSMGSVDQNRGINNWEAAALATKSRGSDHIIGSNTQVFREETGWNNIPFVNLLALNGMVSGNSAASATVTQRGSNIAASGHFFPISYSQIDGSQQQSNSAGMLLANQNFSINSNLWNNSSCPPQIPQYGFPVPYHPTYNLNSPPRTIAGPVSNGAVTFQVAPVTPGQGQKVQNDRPPEIANIYLDERSNQERDKHQDAVNSTGNKSIEPHSKESLLQAVVDSSSAALSTPLKENYYPNGGEEHGIDLNKTPEQKPRKKKHRPKVVREGKPKRTPKPVTPKQTGTKENPSGKRKYVRKKDIRASNTPSEDVVGEITDPMHKDAGKSCKRALNFDFEGQARDGIHGTTMGHQEGQLHSSVDSSSCGLAVNFNPESQGQNLRPEINSGTRSTLQLAQGLEVIVENSPAGIAFDLNRILDDYLSLPEKPGPTTPPPTRKDPPRENLKILTRNRNDTATAGASLNRGETGYAPTHQHIHAEGIGHTLIPTETACDNHKNDLPSIMQSDIQLISKSRNDSNCSHVPLAESEQARGSKRGYCHTINETHLRSMNLIGAHYNSLQVYQEIFRGNEYHRNGSSLGLHFPEIYKKKRTEKGQNTVISSTLSSLAPAVGDDARQATACSVNDATANFLASQPNSRGSTLQFDNFDGTKNLKNGASNSVHMYPQSMAAGHKCRVQSIPAELLSCIESLSGSTPNKLQASETMLTFGQAERKTKKRTKGPTRVRDLASLTAIAECNKFLSTPKTASTCSDRQGIEILHGPQACMEALAADNHAKMATKKRTKKGTTLVNSVSNSSANEACLQKHEVSVYAYHQSSSKSRGPLEVTRPFNVPIDELVQRLNRLSINEWSNALVPFGGDGSMVPYEGMFDPTKKRRSRPKVDLDPETDRVWKLLMGKEVTEGVEGTDANKEKWWEEERRVFRGRADSFIARMHLVQGDRRFSRWKGSVVDSVIGVFLTQNVSDHLSSSAFMSLAARFPLESTSNNRTCNEEGANISLEEPEVSILDSDVTIKWHKKISSKPACDQGSVTHHEADHIEEKEITNSNESLGSNMEDLGSADISKGKQLVACKSGLEMCHESPENRIDNLTTGTGCASLVEAEDRRALKDVVSSQNSVVSYQKSVDSSSILQTAEGSMTTGIRRASLVEAEDGRALEDVVSSQNSVDSSILQTAERIGSCSDSNSEAEDLINGCKSNSFKGSTSFMELLHMAGTTMLQEYYSPGSGSLSLNVNSISGHCQSEGVESVKRRSSSNKVDGLKDSLPIYSSNSHLPLTRTPIIPSSNYRLHMTPDSGILEVECLEVLGEESGISLPTSASEIRETKDIDSISKRNGPMAEIVSQTTAQQKMPSNAQATSTTDPFTSLGKHSLQPLLGSEQEAYLQKHPHSYNNRQGQRIETFRPKSTTAAEAKNLVDALAQRRNNRMSQTHSNLQKFSGETLDVVESTHLVDKQKSIENKVVESNSNEQVYSSDKASNGTAANTSKAKGKIEREKKKTFDWDSLRKETCRTGAKREKSKNAMDSLDWEAVRSADVNEIAKAIKERGMNNMLAERIQDFLNRLVRDHGSTDLEWLRDVPPDKAKEYLLSVRGLGLKSVECVRLLTLHHLAFPVDTNVGRIAVRLGWVPLQPLPESLQLHLLELYPVLESIQKYLWPRLCTLDQRTLYELHYQMITFGKVFCTKSKPNCNACPMRAECKHFASAFASARLALPGPEEKGIVSSTVPTTTNQNPAMGIKPMPLPPPEAHALSETRSRINKCEPIIEEPATPEPECIEMPESDIEDAFYDDPDEIPTIKLNIEDFAMNLQNYMQQNNMELQECDMSKALVALTPEIASIPMPKLKNVSRLRTEHQVYELPDSHPLLKGLAIREFDDPSPYLLAIWTPGETAESIQPPERCCGSQVAGNLCSEKTCFSCNSVREANSQTVRGTILIPCKTAMRGSFPLNGTYFQVNEVFADHDSSLKPIDVPRSWLWNLPRRTVLFGTSIPTIFKGQSTEEIQSCFWKGFVCVRGFDQKTRAPRPLMARLHFPASKLARERKQAKSRP